MKFEFTEHFSTLNDISCAIKMQRTLNEAELALKLERDFRQDPTILQDIDFRAIAVRLQKDLQISDSRLSTMLSAEEVSALRERQAAADAALRSVLPRYVTRDAGAVAAAVPKLRRVISKARELPLAMELPKAVTAHEGGVDIQAAMRESTNVMVAAKAVWARLNGVDSTKEEELAALQTESKAILSLRAEATKLRTGIGLLRRQRELKKSALIRYDSDALLEETLRADSSIMRLQKELSLKAAVLEIERIFLVLESELRSSSLLTNQLLPMVSRYGHVEGAIADMVKQVQRDEYEAIDDAKLSEIEREIANLLVSLGLQTTEQESLSWSSSREALRANLNKARQGVAFYARGAVLFGKDVQLLVNIVSRAVLQGYTLRTREVKLLRRILKDMLTIIPFIIILIIPLSPLGHVLVFSFIQRFFPDFFPSQFTESRQQMMSMYSSLTSPDDGFVDDTEAPAEKAANKEPKQP